MYNVSPQRYKAKGLELGVNPTILDNATKAALKISSVNPQLFPLLTLNHLSVSTGIPYRFLRQAVAHKAGHYRHFYVKKRVPGRKNVRMISVPDTNLMQCQKWIVDNILKFGDNHPKSYAYHPASNPFFAACEHPNTKWLIKVDIQDFFHAITEHDVYRAFRSLGYVKLLSLELARLCTMPCETTQKSNSLSDKYKNPAIEYYRTPYVGILPQGAPTSPMLSNLVMYKIDQKLAKLASDSNMRFTRYADDIIFSCSDKRAHDEIKHTKRAILRILNDNGFRPNLRKTTIRGPGVRKIVLGMLVDSSRPRLTREYKDIIRMHLHYLTHKDFGPACHAAARKASISKIYYHVLGIICWARIVEPEFGNSALIKFNSINWPPIVKPEYYTNLT